MIQLTEAIKATNVQQTDHIELTTSEIQEATDDEKTTDPRL